MGPPTASQPCDANFVISRCKCKGSYRAYLQGPPLEKRAQPSAGGESRIDLSFLDLNCTGARDTDSGHPSPPISPKRGRLRLSPSAEVLCNELTPRAHGSIHLLDSSSTPFADQRGQSAQMATKGPAWVPKATTKTMLSPHSPAPSGTQTQRSGDLSKAVAQLVKALPGMYGALYSLPNMTEI